jgi:RNA polymerase sigma-70 factor (ECF subfamily)
LIAARTLAALRSASVDERDDAWRTLYDEHFDRVYRLVVRFGVPPGDVEDVTQQAFFIAYRRLREMADVQCVPAWLRGIVVRVASENYRWRHVRRVKQWLVEATVDTAWSRPARPDRSAEVSETQARVGQVLAAMSPKLRAVLVLLDLEGLSIAEVARTLGIPDNTVRSRRRLARRAFERLWRAEHGDDRGKDHG